MNSPTNNKNLEDLLKKDGSASLDDFEREALEGFHSLESPEKALEIKSELDSKIYSEVFSKKKSGPKMYWYAAAGLILLIGLSVFFFMNTGIGEKKKMAIVSDEMKPAEQNRERDQSPSKEITGPLKTKEIENSGTLKNEVRPATGKSSGNSSVDTKQNNKSSAIEEDIPSSAKEGENFTALAEQTNHKADKSIEDISNRSEGKIKPEEESKYKSNAQLEEVAINTRAAADELKSETSKKSKRSSKSPAQAPALKDNEPDFDLKKSREQDDLAKNNASGGNENNSVAGNNIPQKSEEKEKFAAEKTTSAPGSAAVPNGYNTNLNNCYYSGGESALIKDIKERLAEKNLNKKFDAILFINIKKEVEKVIFTRTYDLNKDEQVHIAESLKTLRNFNFNNNGAGNIPVEYKLTYRP